MGFSENHPVIREAVRRGLIPPAPSRNAGVLAGMTRADLAAIQPAADRDEVVVPVPPSANNLFLTAGRRRVKTPAYTEWLKAAVPLLARLRRPARTPVEVRVTVTGGNGWNPARDIANVEKAITDALVEAGVLADDSTRAGVWRCVQEFRPGNAGDDAVVAVRVTELTAGGD